MFCVINCLIAGAGYPMGPFELADFIGLDILQSIVKGWTANFYQYTRIVYEEISVHELQHSMSIRPK